MLWNLKNLPIFMRDFFSLMSALFGRKKKKTWDLIADEFNAKLPEDYRRDAEALAKKYRNMKATLKKKIGEMGVIKGSVISHDQLDNVDEEDQVALMGLIAPYRAILDHKEDS